MMNTMNIMYVIVTAFQGNSFPHREGDGGSLDGESVRFLNGVVIASSDRRLVGLTLCTGVLVAFSIDNAYLTGVLNVVLI